MPGTDSHTNPFFFVTLVPFVVRFSGGSNSVVESQPSKLLVAGSIPVSRSKNW